MAEVPVDFEVEIERENGADGLKKSEGSNGVSGDHCRLRYSGNTHCFREEDDFLAEILSRDFVCVLGCTTCGSSGYNALLSVEYMFPLLLLFLNF